ncbi:MAG: efflux transporter periplasmic adaptor subunit, partial [Candidatus Dechloromonas phosphoritropha]
MLPCKLVPPAVALCIVIVLSGCGSTEPPLPAVTSVLVQPAGVRDAGHAIYTGEIRARHEADLSFRVGGKIA